MKMLINEKMKKIKRKKNLPMLMIAVDVFHVPDEDV